MKTAKVLFDNGDSITTGINGTDEEIRDYYKIGRQFNLGHNGNDLMAQVTSVEIQGITGLETMTAEEGRETIREIMTAYDKYRQLWITKFGTDEGFDDWFRKQTI